MHDYANLSLWTAITNNPGKDLLFPRSPNLAQKPLYLVGTVLKSMRDAQQRADVHFVKE